MKIQEKLECGCIVTRINEDSQILAFDSEAIEHEYKYGYVYKIEQSNSTLRWILTIWSRHLCDFRFDDKGTYVKTLKMNLVDSIEMAKKILVNEKFWIAEQAKVTKICRTCKQFESWYLNL